MQDVKAHCWTRISIIWVVTGSCRWWSKWLVKISFWTLEVKFFYCVNHSICCQEKYFYYKGVCLSLAFFAYRESSVEGQEGCLRGVLPANLGKLYLTASRYLAISRRGESADETDSLSSLLALNLLFSQDV